MKNTRTLSSFAVSSGRGAILGLVAALFLASIEYLDTSIQLTPVFKHPSYRFVFAAYFSLNLVGGALIGMIAGLLAESTFHLFAMSKSRPDGAVGRVLRNLIPVVLFCGIAGSMLNQQPQIAAYATALLREAEKLSSFTPLLVRNENAFSYLVVIGLLTVCALGCLITRTSQTWRPSLRLLWIAAVVGSIGTCYYIDSRIEVQLYEPSLHQSMFLANSMLSISLAGTIWLGPGRSRWSSLRNSPKRALIVFVSVLILASVIFTFAYFDKNENLKTQIFYRTTQAKQYFRLARWLLDFDRDGYSRFLGGGDTDDNNAGINPSALEIVGDEVDNNCIGGDLTQTDITAWNEERGGLRIPSNPSKRRYNLIYIFIDALRADHLGAYGYRRNTSPNIDRLAARSTVFDNAYTPSPFTYAALPKFMQSSYWDGHYETWTEVLSRNNYQTFLFPARITFHLKRHIKGMSQVINANGRGLPEIVNGVIDVIATARQETPFCAYLYVPDPHMPYVRHPGFDFGSSIVDLYDSEIAFTDAALGRLFDWLEESGRMNDTMVVIMADHAESLGERGVYKHSVQLYDDQAQIPMLFYLPGLAAHRVTDYVSSIDLGTTILNAVGIEPPKEYIGVSLLPLMRGEPFVHPPVYGEQVYTHDSRFSPPEKYTHPATKKFMVITQDGYKLIYNRDFYTFELYNLRTDQNESDNLYNQMPEKAQQLRKLVGRFVDITQVSRPWDAEETWVEPPRKRRQREPNDEE